MVAVGPNGNERTTTIFRITDPGKAWKPCSEAPMLPQKVRLLMVYTKARAPGPTNFEACLLAVDTSGEMKVFHVPSDLDQPWVLISTLPFAGDTRLSCIYVPGKPEPLLMVGSPTEKKQKLCHLNLMEWRLVKEDDRRPPPKAPVLEEKFSRPMSSLWPGNAREGCDPETVVALPVDCTADLPVSRHSWVTTPIIPPGADYRPGAPGFDGRPSRPPFDYPGPPGSGPPPPRPPFQALAGPPGFEPRPDAPPAPAGPDLDLGPPPGDLSRPEAAPPERHRRRRHRHRRGEEGDGEGHEGRKRRRAEKAEQNHYIETDPGSAVQKRSGDSGVWLVVIHRAPEEWAERNAACQKTVKI